MRGKTLQFSLAALALHACAEERTAIEPPAPPASVVAQIPDAPDPRKRPAAEPLSARSTIGSTIQLARFTDRDVVLIADEDARAVRVVDAQTLKERSHTRLPGHPAQLVVAADGRAYVALRDRNRVLALEMKGDVLETAAEIATATEPVAVSTTPDGRQLLVASAWGAKLERFDVKTHAKARSWSLGREPRAIAVSADGQTAHVVHAVGSRISRVDLAQPTHDELTLAGTDFSPRRVVCCLGRRDVPRPPPKPKPTGGRAIFNTLRSGMNSGQAHDRDAVQGFAVAIVDDRVVAPVVLVHGEEQTQSGYGSADGYPPHQPALAIVDGDDAVLRVARNVFRSNESRTVWLGGATKEDCFLPRGAAADDNSKTVLITCLGTNEVRVIDAERDTNLNRGTRARYQVPSGPTGVAVDAERKRALVWSQFARELAAVPLVDPAPAETKEERNKRLKKAAKLPKRVTARVVMTLGPIPDEAPALSAAAARGRELFHGASDPRISIDGRTCASCHPDGREDGLVWSTPFGKRQTPMLAGRLAEALAPFGWHGDEPTVAGHLSQTFRRLHGTGLKGEELDALIAYCREMHTPPALEVADPDLVEHGKKLFFADTVGCATCHVDGGGSDGSRHAVGSGPKLDTPSLRFVAGTAPYFHDGRYQTLAELLQHSQGKMGWGQNMTKRDLSGLEAYLLTL